MQDYPPGWREKGHAHAQRYTTHLSNIRQDSKDRILVHNVRRCLLPFVRIQTGEGGRVLCSSLVSQNKKKQPKLMGVLFRQAKLHVCSTIQNHAVQYVYGKDVQMVVESPQT